MADGLPILIEFDSASTAAEVRIKPFSHLCISHDYDLHMRCSLKPHLLIILYGDFLIY